MRARGEGTLSYDKAADRWRGIIDLGTDGYGKRRRVKVTAKTRAEAAAKLAAKRADLKTTNQSRSTVTGFEPMELADPVSLSGERLDVVYYIECPAARRVKIGHSRHVVSRFGTLMSGCPYPISLVGMELGGARQERERHRQFAHLRAHGEWFLVDELVMNTIGQLRLDWDAATGGMRSAEPIAAILRTPAIAMENILNVGRAS